MFTKEEVRQNMIGCIEILLFMKSGIGRFKHVTKKDALKSFIIVAALFPVAMAVQVVLSKDGYSVPYLVLVHSTRYILDMFIHLGAIYYVSKLLDRSQYFPDFLVVANWYEIITFFMALPILAFLFNGMDVQLLGNYPIFITVIIIVYSGFVMTHAFRIPWEMGGFMAVMNMAISQMVWKTQMFLVGDLRAIAG